MKFLIWGSTYVTDSVTNIVSVRPMRLFDELIDSFVQYESIYLLLRQNSFLVCSCTLLFAVIISFIIGYKRSGSRRLRKQLEEQLKHAKRAVMDLEHKLMTLEVNDNDNNASNSRKEIRIWMDGAFDMMHFGHMNAFRQGKALGTRLIVGINSDDSITQCKGKPVNTDHERSETVRACKWVDEVVTNVPYIMNEEYLQWVIKTYKIDYVVHGDDPCIVDGKDVYESAQKMGKYLTIPRTEGISTTDIVGRMLLMTRSHHDRSSSFDETSDIVQSPTPDKKLASNSIEVFTRKSNFLTTSRVVRLFGAGVKAPKKTDKVVYIDGSWDMFHAGHVSILEKARAFGDYIIVGIYNDEVVNSNLGINLPILSLHERVLSVLGCKFVDDVLIDAPYTVTKEMIDSLNIAVVVKGLSDNSTHTSHNDLASLDTSSNSNSNFSGNDNLSPGDAYALPRKMGILQEINSGSTLNVLDIIKRVHGQRDRYTEKYARKKVAEENFYAEKYKK